MTLLNKFWNFYERIVRSFLSFFARLLKKKIGEETTNKIVEFAKFCLVGVLNTVISLLCYYAIVMINSDLYILGNIVGFFVSVLNSFFWNSNFVFKKTNNLGGRLIKSMLSYGFSLVLGTILLYVMVDIMGISEMIAPILNIIITTPINFVINKIWAYKQ